MSCICKNHELECDGYGVIPAKFMFVGLSAGKLGALLTKVPFTKDGSGRLFQRMLGSLGFSKSDELSIKPKLKKVYVTNLAKGRYVDDKGNNRLPTNEEIKDWNKYIKNEIEIVQPEKILTMGKLVYETLKVDFDNVIYLKHPRWYFSHGGIKNGSKASNQMIQDYATELGVKI